MNVIEFSYNWNNKLDCKAFTTLRLANPERFKVGAEYRIVSKDGDHGTARIEAIREITLPKINEFIARLDTGYSAEECKKIIRQMYAGKVKDVEKATFYLMLLVKKEQEQ